MSQPFVGEIRMFGGNFPPNGWQLCQGQLMPISQYEVLFQLIGTTYGGDGQETFALPNLQSRIPLHAGTLPGGSTYIMGQQAGSEQVTLTSNQLPIHNHIALASNAPSSSDPTNAVPAGDGSTSPNWFAPAPVSGSMAPQALSVSGGSQPHDNMVPFLVVNFIISMFGVFPSQN